MIAGFAPAGGRLRPVGDSLADLEGLVWIDLLNPTAEEETTLEAQLASTFLRARRCNGSRSRAGCIARKTPSS